MKLPFLFQSLCNLVDKCICELNNNPYDQIFRQPSVITSDSFMLWNCYVFLLHTVPGQIIDTILKMAGRKPMLVGACYRGGYALHMDRTLGRCISLQSSQRNVSRMHSSESEASMHGKHWIDPETKSCWVITTWRPWNVLLTNNGFHIAEILCKNSINNNYCWFY